MKAFLVKALAFVILALVVMVPTLLLCAVSVLARGFVLCKLWTWFMLPLGAPQIGMVSALGVALLVNYATWHNAVTNKVEGDSAGAVVKSAIYQCLGTPLVVLLMGWIIHLFQ